MYSRTGCRVQASHWERSRLGAEVSSGPLFVIRCGPTVQLCSKLLSAALMTRDLRDNARNVSCRSERTRAISHRLRSEADGTYIVEVKTRRWGRRWRSPIPRTETAVTGTSRSEYPMGPSCGSSLRIPRPGVSRVESSLTQSAPVRVPETQPVPSHALRASRFGESKK
jgi:hypothetical protein